MLACLAAFARLILPPNGICAVPAEAIQISEEGKAFTFVSNLG